MYRAQWTPFVWDGWMLYVIRRPDTREIKIGISKNPLRRLHDLQACHARPLEMLAVARGDVAAEAAALERFKVHRISGEWFHECPEILEWAATLGSPTPRSHPRCEGRGGVAVIG